MDRPSMAEIFQRFQPGVDLGTSDWIQITQEMVDKFGESTLDDDPMHVDPDWARRYSPFGKTVAFGFLTISLLTHVLLQQLLKADSSRHDAEKGVYLNYGFARLRLVAPVGLERRGHWESWPCHPQRYRGCARRRRKRCRRLCSARPGGRSRRVRRPRAPAG